MKHNITKVLFITVMAMVLDLSAVFATEVALGEPKISVENYYASSKKKSRSQSSQGRYISAIYQWVSPADEDEYTEIEFRKDGKCIIKEDIVTDLIYCELKYVVKGNTIQLIWGNGKKENLRFEGNTLIRGGKRFYRL